VTSPGYLRAVFLIAAKDLRLELRTVQALSSMFALALATIFAFAFTLGYKTMSGIDPVMLAPAVLWVTLTFASLLGFQHAFVSERERDAIDGLRLAPVDRSAIYLGKLAALLATVFALEAALVPLTGVFFGVDLFGVFAPLLLVLTLHTWGLCALGTLLGALVSRLRRGEALAAILLLPLVVPLLVSAGKCTPAVLAGRPLLEVRFWLVLAAAFGAVVTAISVLLFDPLLEE
jgi:heme exporter protein B